MKLPNLVLSALLTLTLTITQSSASTPSAASTSVSPAAASDSTASYTITALPAVTAQPPCVFNCLIPIGLADPSGCDDVTNECACLGAPADVLDVLTSCIQTVCSSSTSAYAAVATGLYQSYCQSIFGAAQLSQAFASESAAAAASSKSTATATLTASATSATVTGGSAAGTTTSLLTLSLCVVGGILSLVVL